MDQKKPYRAPLGQVMDFDNYLDASFHAAGLDKMLPLFPAWDYACRATRERHARCDACGEYSRGRVLIHLRHPDVIGDLQCCRVCCLKLMHMDAPQIAEAEAEEKLPDARRFRDEFVAFRSRLQNLANWTSPAPFVIEIRTDDCVIAIDGREGDGWAWNVALASDVLHGNSFGGGGTEATELAAFAQAGWEAFNETRYRDRMEAEALTERHATACEVAGLDDLAKAEAAQAMAVRDLHASRKEAAERRRRRAWVRGRRRAGHRAEMGR